uniref:Peptidase S1 domain-containing protein n=1 Tax=Steinernema glaseri TaxID=37863 RepID=A0A1I8AG85_9BILA
MLICTLLRTVRAHQTPLLEMELFVLLVFVTMSQGSPLTCEENKDRLSRCGVLQSHSEGETDSSQFKILGGRNSGPRPYAVQLIYENDVIVDQCGGTMISSRHVLTAAHCVHEDRKKFCNGTLYAPRNNATRWTVVLKSRCGHYNIDPSCEEKDQKIFAKPTKIFVNRRFYKGHCKKGGDIAILELDRDYLPQEGVVPACLASDYTELNEYNTQNLTVFGWGFDPELNSFKTHGGFHSYLQEVNLKLQNCSRYVARDALCTEEIDNNVCKGDSGGGLIIPSANENRPTVIGITSYGSECIDMWVKFKKKFDGGVFTDVRKYNKFICDTTGVCPTTTPKKQRKTVLDEITLF